MTLAARYSTLDRLKPCVQQYKNSAYTLVYLRSLPFYIALHTIFPNDAPFPVRTLNLYTKRIFIQTKLIR